MHLKPAPRRVALSAIQKAGVAGPDPLSRLAEQVSRGLGGGQECGAGNGSVAGVRHPLIPAPLDDPACTREQPRVGLPHRVDYFGGSVDFRGDTVGPAKEVPAVHVEQ